jgi:rhomboid protease GluP
MSDDHPAPVVDEARAFHDRVHAMTPRVFVTPAIIVANVIVFALGLARGASIMSPTIDELIAGGANYGPLTTAGEWWRLLTSTFVHVGIIHIAMNMLVLAQIGPMVERLVGNVGFLLLYLATGVLASLTSLAWNPFIVSAGASGAVFGCYGIFLGILLRNRDSIPPAVRKRLLNGAAVFVLYNVVFGASIANIDQAAHFGGLASGLLAGLAVALPLVPEAAPRRLARSLTVSAVAAAAAVGIAFAVPRTVDWKAEIGATGALETRLNGVLTAADTRVRAKEIDEKALAALIRRDVLPEWKAQRDRLAEIHGMRGQPRTVVDKVVRYMDAKARGWTLFAEALDTNDATKSDGANKAFEEADAIAKSFGSEK